jgi:DUF1680 family protein
MANNCLWQYLTQVGLKQCRLTDGFWKKRQKLIHDFVLPYQWRILNDEVPDTAPSGAVMNFRIAAGEAKGNFYGRPFQDSDLYKWLEAVAFSLQNEPDENLEKLADSVIDLIGRAQQPDGYLDTLYIIGNRLDKRWTNLRDDHELYCAGHLIEAAAAYYQATNKTKILDIACRLADHICMTIGPNDGQLHGYPGHEEIELALMKLYRLTKEKRYFVQAVYFVNERGNSPLFFEQEAMAREEPKPYGPTKGRYTYQYNQSHLPVRQQKTAVGHAVRALYFYAGVTDVAVETEDASLLESIDGLWENVVNKQMYVTGSVGSSHFGEAFTIDYDLPNDLAYNETCASVALVLWAHRMLQLKRNGSYADIMERALFNGVLAGMSNDGKRFFYVNPLEIWPASVKARNDKAHIALERQQWFTCSCCPPNVARLLASLSGYFYSMDENNIYAHLYGNCDLSVNVNGAEVKIVQESDYPWNGRISFTVTAEKPVEMTMFFRIPSWCKNYSLSINGDIVKEQVRNGYVRYTQIWQNNTNILLLLKMENIRVYASPMLRAAAGKVSIQRGPLIYCMEEADNGVCLDDIQIESSPLIDRWDSELLNGVVAITASASRSKDFDSPLYSDTKVPRIPFNVKFIPYFTWNNRGIGEMKVWVYGE